MIAPGVPDIHSMRCALEMGYDIHDDGLWWPIYNFDKFDAIDNPPKCIWPQYIYNQWKRLGIKMYLSPNNKTTKELPMESK